MCERVTFSFTLLQNYLFGVFLHLYWWFLCFVLFFFWPKLLPTHTNKHQIKSKIKNQNEQYLSVQNVRFFCRQSSSSKIMIKVDRFKMEIPFLWNFIGRQRNHIFWIVIACAHRKTCYAIYSILWNLFLHFSFLLFRERRQLSFKFTKNFNDNHHHRWMMIILSNVTFHWVFVLFHFISFALSFVDEMNECCSLHSFIVWFLFDQIDNCVVVVVWLRKKANQLMMLIFPPLIFFLLLSGCCVFEIPIHFEWYLCVQLSISFLIFQI